jgi:hypothetical protein
MAIDREVTIRIGADGSVAIGELKKVEDSLKRLEQSTGGIIQTVKQHWLGLAATVTAVGASLYKAFDLANKAAEFQEQMTALDRLAAKYNTTGQSIIKDLKAVTNQQISMEEASKMAAKGLMMGLNPNILKEFAKEADTLADIMGGDLVETFDMLINAAAKGRVGFLAEMGVIVDLEQAYQDYAHSIGKATKELTEQERLQARIKAVMEAVKEATAKVGDAQLDAADKYKQLKAIISDTILKISQAIHPLIDNIATAFIENIPKIENAIRSLIKTLNEYQTVIKAVAIAMGSFLIMKFVATSSVITQLILVIRNLSSVLQSFAVITLPSLLNPLGILAASIGAIAYAYFKMKDSQNAAKREIEEFKLSLQGMNKELLQAQLNIVKYELEMAQLRKEQAAMMKSGLFGGQMSDYTKQRIEQSPLSFTPLTEAQRQYKQAIIENNKLLEQKKALEEQIEKVAKSSISGANEGNQKQKKNYEELAKAAKEVAMALQSWQDTIDALNPSLDDHERAVLNLWKQYEKLKAGLIEKKASPEAFKEAQAAFMRGLEFINEKNIAEQQKKLGEVKRNYEKFVRDTEIEFKEGYDRIEDEIEAWIDDMITQHGYSEDAISKIIELGEQKRLKKIKDYNEQMLEDYKASQKKKLEYTQEYNELILELESDTTTKEGVLDYLEKKKRLYEDLIRLMEDAVDQGLVDERKLLTLQIALKGVNQELKEMKKNFVDGWQQGIKEYVESTEMGFEQGRQLANQTAYEMLDAFEKMFFGKFKEGLKSLIEFFKQTLVRMIAIALANPIIIPMMGAMQGIFGTAGAGITGVAGMTGRFSGFGIPFGGGLISGLASLFPNSQFMANLATGYYYPLSGGAAGLLGTGLGLLGSGLFGYGIGSMFGGYGGIGGALGGAAGYVLSSSLNFALPGLGSLLGGLVGGLIGSLFKKEKKEPKIGIAYSERGNFPDWKYGGARVSGDYAFLTGGGAGRKISSEFSTAVIKEFKDMRERTKKILEDLGLDVSGFAKDWSYKIKLKGKSQEEIMSELKKAMAKYIEFASKIDFKQFKKDGEVFADTVDRIITALSRIAEYVKEDSQATDIWGIYNKINLHANTYKEALDDLDKQINEAIDGLSDLSGQQWGDQITHIGELLTQRYELEVRYLTYIKELQENINQDIEKTKESIKLDTMTREQKIDYYKQRIEELYDELLQTTDPTRVAELYKELKSYFSAGWALMTEEERKAYLQNATAFFDEIQKYMDEVLKGAVDEQQQVVDDLAAKLEAIDWTPLYKLSDAAQQAADNLKKIPETTGIEYVPPYNPHEYQTGLDYVPYDNFPAILHRGEAVITAEGNEALKLIANNLSQPVVINISGDIAPFIKVAADEGAKRAIQIIRREPAVLR